MIMARDALRRLREGNVRFVSDASERQVLTSQNRRSELANGQEPFAIILGCSDSRVPAEIVFDQGLGDLFVIRVAGNIVAPSQVGSIEFAAERFGTQLVVVLGHSSCGAILATLEELGQGETSGRPSLRSIVGRIRPAVEGLAAAYGNDGNALVRAAVRANIRASANQLRHGSDVLEQLVQAKSLFVVGAEYSLETGHVDFFEGVGDVGFAEGPEAPVQLVPYDPSWPSLFDEERALLERTLAAWITGGIEHVGSTAIPGVVAKPVIDIMVGVESLDASRAAISALARIGYKYVPYKPDVMHWLCKPSLAFRTHHLHLVPFGSPLWKERLAFRDYLLRNAAVAKEYGELKQQLARQYKFDREAYTDAKEPFVRRVLGLAGKDAPGA